MFSGGSYDEVARWLKMFLNSHAKREDPRVEAEVDDDGDERVAYTVRLRLEERVSAPFRFDYQEVAAHRGELAWCAELAERARREARTLLAGRAAADVSRSR